MSSRPAWCTGLVPGHPELLNREKLSHLSPSKQKWDMEHMPWCLLTLHHVMSMLYLCIAFFILHVCSWLKHTLCFSLIYYWISLLIPPYEIIIMLLEGFLYKHCYRQIHFPWTYISSTTFSFLSSCDTLTQWCMSQGLCHSRWVPHWVVQSAWLL